MSVKRDNSAIYRMYDGFVARASNIPHFQIGQKADVDYDITELANGFVKAQNENNEFWCDVYCSALMVRYWHMIAKIHKMLKPFGISVEEVVNVLYESLNKAFKYQSWLDDSKYVSKSDKGAEKVINQCITSTVSNYIKALKVNKNTMFVENTDDDFENSVTYDDNYDSSFGCSELVQSLLDMNEFMPAIVVDMIAYKDMATKKMLYNKMSKLDENYFAYFLSKYTIKDENKFVRDVRNFNDSTDKAKESIINKSIKYLKNNEEFVRLFVC